MMPIELNTIMHSLQEYFTTNANNAARTFVFAPTGCANTGYILSAIFLVGFGNSSGRTRSPLARQRALARHD